VQKSIKEAAKRNDMGSAKVRLCERGAPAPGAQAAAPASPAPAHRAPRTRRPQHLAKEIIQSRRTVSRLYTNKAQLISLNTSLTEQMGAAPRLPGGTTDAAAPRRPAPPQPPKKRRQPPAAPGQHCRAAGQSRRLSPALLRRLAAPA
jgi:hypothetical protein